MTLRQYEAFLKTVECAGVSAAAQALGVSQSALTQLLAGLERDCGFPLLVRNRGGVHLTPAGKALLPAVQQVSLRTRSTGWPGMRPRRSRRPGRWSAWWVSTPP